MDKTAFHNKGQSTCFFSTKPVETDRKGTSRSCYKPPTSPTSNIFTALRIVAQHVETRVQKETLLIFTSHHQPAAASTLHPCLQIPAQPKMLYKRVLKIQLKPRGREQRTSFFDFMLLCVRAAGCYARRTAQLTVMPAKLSTHACPVHTPPAAMQLHWCKTWCFHTPTNARQTCRLPRQDNT